MFVVAAQGMMDQLAAEIQQVGAKLPARTRQVVQRVEVELTGQLLHDAVLGLLSACETREGWCGSRIAAECGAESIDVGVGALVAIFGYTLFLCWSDVGGDEGVVPWLSLCLHVLRVE